LVDRIKKAVLRTKAKIIYFLNLMTKSGQTVNYQASDHLNDLNKYLGRFPDYILINNGHLPKDIIDFYKKYNEIKVVNDLKNDCYKIIEKDLVDNKKFEKNPNDVLYRSILRHDSRKAAEVLLKIFYA